MQHKWRAGALAALKAGRTAFLASTGRIAPPHATNQVRGITGYGNIGNERRDKMNVVPVVGLPSRGVATVTSSSAVASGGDAAFSHFGWTAGQLAECDPQFPTILSAWCTGDGLQLDPDWCTTRQCFTTASSSSDSSSQDCVPLAHFGFVQDGEATLSVASGDYKLKAGMYFSASSPLKIQGGRGIVMTRLNQSALFMLGGPVEKAGRLLYIDGCTDSLLIPPVRFGDACLNLLVFPPGIDQTSHTHPSDRIGVVHSGHGRCVTPDNVVNLVPGMIFRIHAGGEHKFQTDETGMRVIAFHPDSDFGAQDQDHPMINRTIVDGQSAAQLPGIQTKHREIYGEMSSNASP